MDFREGPDDVPSKDSRVGAGQLSISSASPGSSGALVLSSQSRPLLPDEERSDLASFIPNDNVRVGSWILVGVEGGAARQVGD